LHHVTDLSGIGGEKWPDVPRSSRCTMPGRV
jgi:hypothetical protein